MTYTTAEGERQILDTLAAAIEDIAHALAELSEAYERLDENAAGRLEATVFAPVQAAYGCAKRTYAGFAERRGQPAQSFSLPAQVAPSNAARQSIERSVEALVRADLGLAELQDSMLPVEVGDVELRRGLAKVRELADSARAPARELVRTIGR